MTPMILPRPPLMFAFATLAPVPVLLSGALLGGPAVWIGLVMMTLLVVALDAAVHLARGDRHGSEFPAGDSLSVALGLSQFLLLGTAVFGLGRGTALTLPEHLGVFFGIGLWLGQVGNSNAHELIHRADRRLFALGRWAYVSVLFGHHTSAHPKVHHRFVASPKDPNSARLGDTFYGFALRAWRGSFVAGWAAESELLRRRDGRVTPWRHPYMIYTVGAAGMLVLAGLIGGLAGLAWFVALAGYAQMQLLLSDYVQHYGLRRQRRGEKWEPVGPQHSWNAPHWYSGAMMLNAPRHSDHHANPAKPFAALVLPEAKTVPTLPHGLPVMAVLALVPPLWRRMMDRRARKWRHAVRVSAA